MLNKGVYQEGHQFFYELSTYLALRAKGSYQIQNLVTSYANHIMISNEMYPHQDIIKKAIQNYKDQDTLNVITLFDFKRLQYLEQGDLNNYIKVLDKLVHLTEHALDHHLIPNDKLDHFIKTLACLKQNKKIILNKDKDLFVSQLKTYRNEPSFQAIGTYFDIKLAQYFGWTDLIKKIKDVYGPIKGDTYLIQYIENA